MEVARSMDGVNLRLECGWSVGEQLRLLGLELGVGERALALEVGQLAQLAGDAAGAGGLTHVGLERCLVLLSVGDVALRIPSPWAMR